jgi:iron complex outermembrane receptor protein
MEDQNRSLWFATFQDQWNFAKGWELTAGARYDDYSDFGSTTNPRVALVWDTRFDVTSKLMYGRAFRAPSFGEQYFVNNPVTLGNPNLKPESIDTYEMAFDYQPSKNLLWTLSLFHYDIQNQISYIDSGGGSKTAENVNDVEGRGFELEAIWQVAEDLQLKSNFAYQRSKNKSTHEVVPNTPALQFYANGYWKYRENWALDGQYFWIADRHRAAGDPRPEIEDYSLVNLTLRRKNILKNWEAALTVKNVFNEDIREPSPPASAPFDKGITYDYPMESRAIWGEIRCTF